MLQVLCYLHNVLFIYHLILLGFAYPDPTI